MMEILFGQIDIPQAANSFKDLVSVLGISTTFCGILGFVVYKMGTFFANKIYSPMQDSHLSLVVKLEKSLDAQQVVNQQLVSNMEKLSDNMETFQENLVKITSAIDSLTNKVNYLDQILSKKE